MSLEEKFLHWIARATVACGAITAILFVSILLKGSAVANPPSQGYCWQCSVGAGSATTVDLTVGATKGPTASLLICNDEVAGGSDVYVSAGTTTPAAPGTNGGTSWVIKATEKINIDGRWTWLKLLSSSGTINVRLLTSY